MSNCRRLLCRQLSSAYLNYLPFYFLIYRPFSLYLSSCEYWQSCFSFFFFFFFTFQFLVAFPILLFKVSLNSTLTKHVWPIHQRTKARSLTHHCIPKRWNIHFFFFRSIAQDNIQNIQLDRKYKTGGTHKAHAEIFIKYNIVY